MGIGTLDLFHILITLSVIVASAHIGGFLAHKVGLPPIVGELAGGIMLGATFLQRVAPDVQAWLFPHAPTDGTAPAPVLVVLGFCSQVGLLLLLYVGGLQLRRLLTRTDAKAVTWVSLLGVVIPVAAGLIALQLFDVSSYVGSANHLTALKIVLMIELAITSIPVITRIFLDLDLMNTRLARIVLSVAVIEDVLLYVALSLALGMAQTEASSDVSIPYWLGIDPSSGLYVTWHIAASLVLLALASWGFGMSTRSAERPGSRINIIARRSPMAWTLVSILTITAGAMLLGLAPMFGALVAGIVASYDRTEHGIRAQQQVEAVGLAFFIPIYIALIGVSLDLVQHLDAAFTLGILVFGTAIKYGGALLGAFLAREPAPMAHAVAASVNARGGPGLVVASTAFAAGIVDERAYTSLVLLSILTSVGSAAVLSHMLRSSPRITTMIRSDGL